MNGGFRDDVGVETVAEVDRVDVVTVDKRISLKLFAVYMAQTPQTRHMPMSGIVEAR